MEQNHLRAAGAVVLLQPPGICRAFTRSGSCYPPLGLCQLAATVPPEDVVVLDGDGHNWDEVQTIAAVRALAPRLVGMTVTSYTLDLVERFAGRLAALGLPVMVGGPHASLRPLDVFARCPSVTYVVRGEGEAIFPQIVQRLREGAPMQGLPGLCLRREDGHLDLHPTILQVQDFEGLPFPRLAGLPLSSYWCPDARERPMTTMMTTRGCPHRCGFCSSPAVLGKKVRGYAIEAVLDELEFLVHELGVREVSFVDDVFTINQRRALALCEGIRQRGLRFSWFCNARADQVSEVLAQAMASAGCHQVYLGFESGEQAILDRVNKGATVAELEHGAALLRQAGIDRSVGFVIGLPGESDDSVTASIRLAQRVRPERLQFTRFTPLAGSPLEEDGTALRVGFHGGSGDRVDAWVRRAYAECGGKGWGRESW